MISSRFFSYFHFLRRAAVVCSLCLLMALTPAPLHAQEAQQLSPEQQAQGIKQFIEDVIAQQTEIQKLAGEQYEWTGDVRVEPSGNYFAVTLPYLKIKQSTGNTIDIGMFAINTAPAQEEGMWKMAIAIPTPIKIYDKLGALENTVSIGKQRLNGLWISDIKQFLKLNGALQDVVVTDSQDVTVATIPQSHIKYDFNIVADNIWDGTYSIGASDIAFNMPGEQVSGSIGSLFFNGSADGFKASRIKEFQEQMTEASQGLTADDINNPASGAQITENMQAVGTALFDYLADFGSGSTGTFGIKDIKLSMPDPEAPDSKIELQASEISSSVEMLGMDTDNSKLAFGIKFIGMDATAETTAEDASNLAKFSPYIPGDIALKLSVVDFPYQSFMASTGEGLGQMMAMDQNASEEDTQAAIMQNLPDINKLIEEHNSRLVLEESYIAANLYRIDLGLNVAPAPQSPLKVNGNANIRITGLENVIAQMQEDAKDTESPMFAAQMQQGLAMIPMLQMMGNQVQEDGKTVYVYDFGFESDGRILLNGADLSQMQGALQGGGQPAPQ